MKRVAQKDAYREFLNNKTTRAHAAGFEPFPCSDVLFDYQAFCVGFNVRQGRSALFLDTGLGKTLCELEFCKQVGQKIKGASCLILAPLSVSKQILRMAKEYGYAARIIREASEVVPGINICNYDILDHLEPSAFHAVVLDESSILKNFSGKTANALIQAFKDTPYRLCATATPAPNDHMEIGMHAEFLGIMTSMEMLTRWFINDTSTASQEWRLKGHAKHAFWDWVASWAVMAENPSDLGFDGSRFILPPLNIVHHDIKSPPPPTKKGYGLFPVVDLSAINMHEIKRHTAETRAMAVRDIIAKEPNEVWLVWCDTDYEADAIQKHVDIVDVRGSMTRDQKEVRIEDFVLGRSRRLLTKPSIAGMGLNLQHCSRMIFAGRTFSYEQWYQAVRRCWRFGQKLPVTAHVLVTDGEEQINRVIERKSKDHKFMKAAMTAASRRNVSATNSRMVSYNPTSEAEVPSWLS